ncbi:MAG: protease HtpX [Chloroflexota bacterium]|nr:MAG: protease HtpX [Chloroflexota bacterium]
MNTFKTVFLLTALTILLILIGRLLLGPGGMVFAFIMALVMNMGAYWFSDKIALRMAGAHEVSPVEAPQLHQLVEELASYARLPKPKVYIIDNPSPNAFATGRDPKHAVVAVTSGITRLLNRDELAGVLSHELAHVRNRDILIGSIVAVVAGAITMIANMAQWAMLFGGFSRDDEDGGGAGELLGGLLMIIVAPIAATLIQLAISRSREYEADATGARILGHPLALANALQKLEHAAAVVPMDASPATAHMYIVNPLKGRTLAGLFSTHPPIEERVARLHRMAQHAGSYGMSM